MKKQEEFLFKNWMVTKRCDEDVPLRRSAFFAFLCTKVACRHDHEVRIFIRFTPTGIPEPHSSTQRGLSGATNGANVAHSPCGQAVSAAQAVQCWSDDLELNSEGMIMAGHSTGSGCSEFVRFTPE